MKKTWLALLLTLATATTPAWANSADDDAARLLQNQQSKKQNSFASSTALSRMPTAPGTPSYTATFTYFSSTFNLTFWRETIDNKERLFVKFDPLSASVFFCPGGSQYSVLQNGRDYGTAFAVTYGDGSGSVCATLKTSAIFLVDQWSIYTNFDISQAFTISFASTGSSYSGSLSVPVSGGSTSTVTTPTTTPTTTTTTTTTPTTTVDYTATYDPSTNVMTIPRLAVKTPLGTQYYKVNLTLAPISNPMTFYLQSVSNLQ